MTDEFLTDCAGLLAALASVDKQIKACKDKQQLAVLSAVRRAVNEPKVSLADAVPLIDVYTALRKQPGKKPESAPLCVAP